MKTYTLQEFDFLADACMEFTNNALRAQFNNMLEFFAIMLIMSYTAIVLSRHGKITSSTIVLYFQIIVIIVFYFWVFNN